MSGVDYLLAQLQMSTRNVNLDTIVLCLPKPESSRGGMILAGVPIALRPKSVELE